MGSYYKCAIICFLVLGCHHKELPEPEPIELSTENILRLQYEGKKLNAETTWDKKTGWPETEDCDAMLWAGLAKAAGVTSVRLAAGEFEPGKLYRRPERTCWSIDGTHDAESTISRDMVLGYLWGVWKSADNDALRRLQQYGQNNNWIMGEPFPERISDVLITGNLLGLIGRMSCEMYDNCPEYRFIPPIHSENTEDYVSHLTVLFILLDQEIFHSYGRGTSDGKKVIDALYQKTPKDALISFAYHLFQDGDFSDTADLLISPSYQYPSYVRGSVNYFDVHWLFVARLVLNKYKE